MGVAGGAFSLQVIVTQHTSSYKDSTEAFVIIKLINVFLLVHNK